MLVQSTRLFAAAAAAFATLVLSACGPREPELGTVGSVTAATAAAIAGASGAPGGAFAAAAAAVVVPSVPCGDAAFTGGAAAAAPPVVEKRSGPGYVLEVVSAKEAEVGKPVATCLRIKPTAGYHVNLAFPFDVDVTAPAGVDARRPIGKADAESFVEAEARVGVPFVARAPGEKAMQAVVRFSVCAATVCETPVEELAWTTVAK